MLKRERSNLPTDTTIAKWSSSAHLVPEHFSALNIRAFSGSYLAKLLRNHHRALPLPRPFDSNGIARDDGSWQSCLGVRRALVACAISLTVMDAAVRDKPVAAQSKDTVKNFTSTLAHSRARC
jgi:hypothetical protein